MPLPGFTSNKAMWSRASRKEYDVGADKQWRAAAGSISTLAMDRTHRRTRARDVVRLTFSAQMDRIVAWSSQMWSCRSISATIVSREVMHTSLGRRHRERNALQRIRAYAGEGATDESSPGAT